MTTRADSTLTQWLTNFAIANAALAHRGLGMGLNPIHRKGMTDEAYGQIGEARQELEMIWKVSRPGKHLPPLVFHDSVPVDEVVPYDPITKRLLHWNQAMNSNTGLGRVTKFYTGDRKEG